MSCNTGPRFCLSRRNKNNCILRKLKGMQYSNIRTKNKNARRVRSFLYSKEGRGIRIFIHSSLTEGKEGQINTLS